jgi:1-acyl-sn-glycerol-3-phosphate acyltransferase
VVTIPAVFIGLFLLVLTAPVWLPITVIVDLVTGAGRLPTARLGLYAVVFLIHEIIGIAGYGVLTIAHRVMRDRAASLDAHRRIQGWWAGSLVTWAGRLLGLRLDLPDPVDLPPGGLILVSRHASIVDAVVPVVVSSRANRFIHYVMKRELRWVPTLDLFSRRLGNHFVARGAPGDTAGITRFASTALPDSVLTIFPEGTYSTPATRSRVRAALRRRRGDRELIELAAALRHLLPPRPAGTLALLEAQPHRDVVVLGHVGLERVARLVDLRRRLPLTEPVVVRWWHHPRPELPTGSPQLIDWLNDRWRRLDAWVDDVKASRHRPRGKP